jgi:C-terminal processing protease CtpA/Prc
VPVKIERAGSDKPLALRVQPSGEPSRLGISWRVDDAEPGSVFLVRVAPGSPADRAGLQLFDRIYEVDGNRFTTGDQFKELSNTLPSPLELLAESKGQVRTVKVDRLDIVTDDESAPPAAPPVSTSAE